MSAESKEASLGKGRHQQGDEPFISISKRASNVHGFWAPGSSSGWTDGRPPVYCLGMLSIPGAFPFPRDASLDSADIKSVEWDAVPSSQPPSRRECNGPLLLCDGVALPCGYVAHTESS